MFQQFLKAAKILKLIYRTLRASRGAATGSSCCGNSGQCNNDCSVGSTASVFWFYSQIFTNIVTYIHKYTYIYSYKCKYIHTHIHTYIHTYIIHIHTHMRTYMHYITLCYLPTYLSDTHSI